VNGCDEVEVVYGVGGGFGGMDRGEVAVNRQTLRDGLGHYLGEQKGHDQSLRVDVYNDVER